jgi:adenosine deaminase
LVDVVIERGVTIEACPTSNVHVGAISSLEDHPLPRWLKAGVRVCLCTDNTYFSSTTAPLELARVRRIQGMDTEMELRLLQFGHAAAFSRGSRAGAQARSRS